MGTTVEGSRHDARRRRAGMAAPLFICLPFVLHAWALPGCAGDDGATDAGLSPAEPTDAGGSGDAASDSSGADAASDAAMTVVAPYFEDVTSAAGVVASRELPEDYQTLPDRMGGGVCIVDVDGVAPLDLFFAFRAGRGGGSRLFVGAGPLDYEDETIARGLADAGDALGCLAGDFDGDGDDDLLVTGLGGVRLFDNAAGSFVDVTRRLDAAFVPGAMYMSAAAGDIDGDGDLDLLVAGYLRFDPGAVPPGGCFALPCRADVITHLPVPNLLFIQGPDGAYTDRAPSLAPDLAAAEPTLVVAVADLDGDRRPDLYVGNDLGFAYYDRVLVQPAGAGGVVDPRGPREDRGEALGLAYNGRGYGIDSMGWTMGDVDGSGSFDFVVTAFEEDPTSLFICAPLGPCEERGASRGLEARGASFRWGAGLFDVDLDGDLDLVEAAGHIYSDSEVEAIGFRGGQRQPPNLFLNDGGGAFAAVAPGGDDGLANALPGRGLAIVDLDDDGRLDVVIASATGSPALLRNVTETAGHFLAISLVGHAPNRAAVGARVTVRTPTREFVRGRILGEGYLGNFDPRLHFGLPAGTERVAVEVRWPSGAVQTAADIEVDQHLTLVEE